MHFPISIQHSLRRVYNYANKELGVIRVYSRVGTIFVYPEKKLPPSLHSSHEERSAVSDSVLVPGEIMHPLGRGQGGRYSSGAFPVEAIR